MQASAEIFFEHERWGRNLAWSAGLHVAVAGAIILYAAFASGGRGQGWGSGGGGGGAISVSVVSTVPLPPSAVPSQNVLANESKGISQSLPKPEAREPEAVPIPDKNAKRKPKPATSASSRKPQRVEEADNIVPFGEGGPVTKLYGAFTAGPVSAGFSFPGSGGDFGTRYAWYVNQVSQKVHQNWLAYEVDPNIHQAPRFYLTFDITRDGRPVNVKVDQSSGIPSLDLSAVRALQRIDTFGPLPSDYSGNKVSVEFSFDYNR